MNSQNIAKLALFSGSTHNKRRKKKPAKLNLLELERQARKHFAYKDALYLESQYKIK